MDKKNVEDLFCLKHSSVYTIFNFIYMSCVKENGSGTSQAIFNKLQLSKDISNEQCRAVSCAQTREIENRKTTGTSAYT
jgi:hypothetical protein